MRCSCCGKKINGLSHGPFDDNEYYCELCWNDPCLFIPEKVESVFSEPLEFDGALVNDTLLEIIEQFREHSINPHENIHEVWSSIIGESCLDIPVVKINQKGNNIFLGKLKAYELLLLSYVEQWMENDESYQGYQRMLSRSRSKEIKEYLKNCSIPLIPSLLGSIQKSEFTEIESDFGKLRLPILPGTISLLDGQQRTGGFAALFHEFKEMLQKGLLKNDEELEKNYRNLLTFEVPIVLINTKDISENLKKNNPKLSNLTPIDIDTAFFIIINKTQKGINSSLKDELAYRTINAGIEGIPVIEKERWRTEIVPAVNKLNSEGSPLEGLINKGGIPGLKKPVQLNGFITSLKSLYVNNENFKRLDENNKMTFLSNYWLSIREAIPSAFENETYNEYIVTKSIGVYSLNYLASDVFDYCIENNIDPLDKKSIFEIIQKVSKFDWNIDTSPMAYFAGKKGASHAHNMLFGIVFSKG